MRKLQVVGVLLGLVVLVNVGAVWAVQTSYIEHNSEKEFKKGDPNGVLISSRGELTLGQDTRTLLSADGDIWLINAMVKGPDGSVYVATSGKGIIYQLRNGEQPHVIYGKGKSDQKHIFSLAIDAKGRLLAGSGGNQGLLLRFDTSGKWNVLLDDDEIKYIWAIEVGPAGRIYLATGPTGKVLTLDSRGKKQEVLFETKEKNILCLALDSEGMLYAGGDDKGLIYRIDPGSKDVRIVYETDHSEVSALVFDEKGNLYASTADASAARPGAKLVLSDGDTSRPDNEKKEQAEEDSNVNKNAEQTGAEGEDPGTSQDTEEPSSKQVTPPATPEPTGNHTLGSPASSRSSGDGPTRRTPAKVNDVYQISPSGFVRTIFSQAVVILDMAYGGEGQLYLGTGNEAQLLRLDIDRQEAVVLHEADGSVQVSALCVDDGTVYAGLANPGGLLAVRDGYVREGYFESDVIDVKQITQWGKLHLDADIPDGSGVQIATRSGNTSDPKNGGWSDWSEAREVETDVAIDSEPGRFLQYRLDLLSFDGKATPTVREVKLAHKIPNLPPILSDLTVKRDGNSDSSSGKGASRAKFRVTWKAEDANKDKLKYKVYLRELGRANWIRIADDLDKSSYNWDSRTGADGRYEIKVEASDDVSNPLGTGLADSRVSRPIVVDNTPPEVMELGWKIEDKKVSVTAKLRDGLSAIGAVSFSVDSADEWKVAVAADGVYDSREEIVTFTAELEEAGEHLLSIRFDDALGNRMYRNARLDIE